MAYKLIALLVAAAACCCLLVGVSAFPNGAPPGSCRTMQPSHRSQPSDEPSPFVVTFQTQNNGYRAHDQIDVTISSTNTSLLFKGFLLAAKAVSGPNAGEVVGTFVTPSRRSLMARACNGKMVTQSVNRPVNSITATWRAPYRSAGPVIFHATVVEKFLRYWVDVKSEQLNALQ
jgi:hypothetical protein